MTNAKTRRAAPFGKPHAGGRAPFPEIELKRYQFDRICRKADLTWEQVMEADEIDWGPVVHWFGYLPRFHDSEVVSIELCRHPTPSVIRLHAFRMNADTDEHGYYRLDLHAIVTFTLFGIERVELEDWNHQNALMSLEIKKVGDKHQLDIEGAYGVHGLFVAKEISVKIEPWELQSTADQT